jgi:pimeloyl-ACP methyl ester carboxylesterase
MKLAFREFGQGRPLIILHGLFGQSDNWNTLSKNFADHGFHVFALDLRNHGLSPHDNDWTYPLMAEDLNEFIIDRQLNAPIVLGHSMGGKTAMFFETMYPGVSSKLIVVDMAPRATEAKHNNVLKALNAVVFSTITNRKEAEAILNTHIEDFGTKQFLLKNIFWKEVGHKQMAWRFNLRVITEKYNEILAAVPLTVCAVDTLVIRGEKSDYITNSDLEDFAERFPNYKLVTIAGAGHWVHAEQPKEFLNVVLDFIA